MWPKEWKQDNINKVFYNVLLMKLDCNMQVIFYNEPFLHTLVMSLF